MDNISVSSQDSNPSPKVKEKLQFKTKIDSHLNEDTARFLLGGQDKERYHKMTFQYPSHLDEEAESEDS